MVPEKVRRAPHRHSRRHRIIGVARSRLDGHKNRQPVTKGEPPGPQASRWPRCRWRTDGCAAIPHRPWQPVRPPTAIRPGRTSGCQPGRGRRDGSRRSPAGPRTEHRVLYLRRGIPTLSAWPSGWRAPTHRLRGRRVPALSDPQCSQQNVRLDKARRWGRYAMEETDPPHGARNENLTSLPIGRSRFRAYGRRRAYWEGPTSDPSTRGSLINSKNSKDL
jgi:hypothetical protein